MAVSPNPRLNLRGERFGRLTVVEPDGNTLAGQARWRCRCDCGNYAITTSGNLRAGHKRSCGCLRNNDLTGQRFGKLVARRRVGRNPWGAMRWECRCDCGQLHTAAANLLKAGRIRSCGCSSIDRRILSDAEVKEVRLFGDEGWTGIRGNCAAIALAYGVSKGHVWNVIQRDSRGDVPE